jgi:hypothetical protein
MQTTTFITGLAWIASIWSGIIIIVNIPAYFAARVTPKGWTILALHIASIYWILCWA